MLDLVHDKMALPDDALLDAVCAVCQEIIYHPICPECLAVEVEEWLEDKTGMPRLKKVILKSLQHLTSAGRQIRGLRCVTCNHSSAFVCPYCFTEEVYGILKQRKAHKELQQGFLETFNFDFNHRGYSLELSEDFEKLLT